MKALPDALGGLGDLVARSAAPATVALALERIVEHRPEAAARLAVDGDLARAAVAVLAASRSLAGLLAVDPQALDVLAHLDRRPLRGPGTEELVAWQRREFLRIAARDLLGLDALPAVGAALAALAQEVFAEACVLAGEARGLAVVGMGKLGGRELNYASDVDVIFVGEGDPLAVLAIARRCFRVDTNLRPEGRSGRLILPLAAIEAYWDRWAKPWEFQALLKARPVAGDASLGEAFAEAARQRLWGRPFGAEELRSVRAMKARADKAVAARGLADREVKRGRGGIRDAEFAVQLLQLVHGGRDAALRSPNTLEALAELATAGYVDPGDAETLAGGYTFLRLVEHRLQLEDNQQVHAVPKEPAARERLARVLGYRDQASRTALARFDEDLRRHQAAVRAVHEHLYFRPLLEAFAGSASGSASAMPQEAVDARLAAFGFTDPARTGRAVGALTRGLTRASRLMEQMLPLILDWLSKSPDPDLGLLGLEALVGRARPLPGLVAAFRESPETARRLCLVLGTGRRFHRGFERHPELLAELGTDAALAPRGREALVEDAFSALRWRSTPDSRRASLLRLKRAEELRIAVGDVVGQTGVEDVGRGLTHLAEAVLEAAVSTVEPPVALAVIAMGRFGGGELSYASDLDVLLVSGGDDPAAAHHAAEHLKRLVKGATPDAGIYDLDLDLRPEGRLGRLVRSIEEYRPYYQRRALTWERQALVRARPVAGDAALGVAFLDLVDGWVWRPPTHDEVREIRRMKARIERERIPPREDPQFHLKLGKGSLSDIEWTVQLLQMTHGVRAPGTMAAISALEGAGVLSEPDARALGESYRFCERTRNRWFLMLSPSTGSAPPGRDSLPTQPEQLARLAASLGTTGPELRDRYRRVTRRARGVVERLFYGRTS